MGFLDLAERQKSAVDEYGPPRDINDDSDCSSPSDSEYSETPHHDAHPDSQTPSHSTPSTANVHGLPPARVRTPTLIGSLLALPSTRSAPV